MRFCRDQNLSEVEVYGYANALGAGNTGVNQWLTVEQNKSISQDKLAKVEYELADKLDIDLLAEFSY